VKKKQPTKVKPQSKRTPEIKKQVTTSILPFHETFPLTLEFKEDKEKKICMFQCQEHLDTYLKRHKLKKNQYKIYPTKPRQKNEEEA
jgi:hypothetical protein